MKKTLITILTVIGLASCQEQELIPEYESVPKDIYASIEDLNSTKTSMDDNNNVLWSEGDQIVAFMRSTLGVKYQIKERYVGSTAGEFSEVTVQDEDGDLKSGHEIDHNVAVYPYSDAVWCMRNDSSTPAKSYKLNIVLPKTQVYAENSFADEAFPMVAVSANNRLTFRNICGGVKLQLKGEDKIKSIRFEGLSGEFLSGKSSVIAYADGTAPVITMSDEASSSITLDCGDGVQLDSEAPVTFIIAVPPMEFKSGMKITVTDTDGLSRTLTNTSANTINRSMLLTFPVITYTHEGNNSQYPTDPDKFALIDLGLSTKWANFNMGASSPYEPGTNTDWGHKEGKDVTYPTDMNISGSEYDLVHKQLGEEWRLPTAFDFMELEQKCKWTPTVIDNVSGNLVTGPNGNSIFLPDVQYWTGTARERNTDDHDYIYGIEWKPGTGTIATGKYNRPVQGPVKTYPTFTFSVKETGKNTAAVEAAVTDYASFGIEFETELKIKYDNSFFVKPSHVTNGNYTFNISELCSGIEYSASTRVKVLDYYITSDESIRFKTVAAADGDGRIAEPIDLGLSVKWASWNLGASYRNDLGLLLNWGGISTEDETRYDIIKTDISGTDADPATRLWGPEWRLPTASEWRELEVYYYSDRFINGIAGVLLKNSLFLPGKGMTQYMSGEYGYGCYFLYDAYCYVGDLLQSGMKLYVRPVYDPLPQTDIAAISDITASTANLSSSVIRTGGSEVLETGFVYSTEQNPEVDSSCSILADDDFSSVLTGLSANTTYYARPYARNSHGTSYGKEVTFTTLEAPEVVDLSLSGTANCYLVKKSGDYKFKAVQGNSTTAVGVPATASVLWESFGTTTAPNAGEIIESASYEDGYVIFSTPSCFNDGNAVIAVKDASGQILWSWHIWCCSEGYVEQSYANDAGIMMDRNLGATSALPSDGTKTFGLLYQWGRKDPFLPGTASSQEWPAPDLNMDDTKATIEYSVQNPMNFMTIKSSYGKEWFYSGSNYCDITRWSGNAKTIYDPCPEGWKVPDGNFMKKAGFAENGYSRPDLSDGFYLPTDICPEGAWFPMAGYIYGYHGSYKTDRGHIWTTTNGDRTSPYFLSMYYYSVIADWDGWFEPASAFSVRCIKE